MAVARVLSAGVVLLLSLESAVHAADLKPETVAAFDRYVRLTETRMNQEVRRPDTFLWVDRLADGRRRAVDARLRRGDVVVERLQTRAGNQSIGVPDGMIHHWVGVVLVAGARVDEAVKLLQDYDRHAEIYRPAVVASRTLARDGDRFRMHLRFYMKKVIAVTMNTEHEAQFVRLDRHRVYSRIHSTRIAELADAGTANERETPPGRDTGFMWRLNTYWRFIQREEGTYVQCESITLSRDIPFGLGWLIGPFVTDVPKESLMFTLQKTRGALGPAPPKGHNGKTQ